MTDTTQGVQAPTFEGQVWELNPQGDDFKHLLCKIELSSPCSDHKRPIIQELGYITSFLHTVEFDNSIPMIVVIDPWLRGKIPSTH